MAEFFDLGGKTAFIIGGTSGIGLAVARRYRDAGCSVCVGGRTNRLEAGDGKIRFVECDIRDGTSVERAFAEVTAGTESLDVVVINAGIAIDDDNAFAELDVESFDESVRVNTRGSFLCLRHASRTVADGGSIIVTTTSASHFVFPGYVCYSASKSALLILAKHAAAQLGSRGVRVNCISPGTIVTPAQPADDSEAVICRAHTCLGRSGTTDDVVGAYHFLAADDSRYVTAAELVVDGGWAGGVTERSASAIVGAAP